MSAYNEIQIHTTNLASKLTSDEAIDCIKDATIGVIAGIGGLAGTFVGMAAGGLSATAIASAISIGGWAIAGSALAYMIGCIIWDAWD